MSLKGSLSTREAYPKLFVVFGLTLTLAVTFSVLGLLLGYAFYGINALSNPALLADTANPAVISVMKMVQFFASLGTFILPALIAAWLFDNDPAEYLGVKRGSKIQYFVMVLLLMFVSIPFINWMIAANASMHLPESLNGVEEWMKSSEQSAGKITEVFLSTTSVAGLLVNLIIIALLPAIGEELLFRGVVQRLMKELSKNVHVGVFLTAVLFSALHMQFYGFFPRFALGLLLGYLYVWSGSLWLSIAAHFINNGAAVIFAWLASQGKTEYSIDTFGSLPGQEKYLGLSVFLTWTIIFLIYKGFKKSAKV